MNVINSIIENERNAIENYNQDGFSTDKYKRKELFEINEYLQLFNKNDWPSELKRDDVVDMFKKDDDYKSFVAAMMWGSINATRPSKKGDHTTTNFYKALNEGRYTISHKISETRKMLKTGKYIEAYNSLLKGSLKISGVGESYFTKLLFFIGQAEGLTLKPLIYDKWTKMIHISLLFERDEMYKLQSYYTKRALSSAFLSSSPNLISQRSKEKGSAYIDYIERMNELASEHNLDVSNLEAYLFGYPLRGKKGKSQINPRFKILTALKYRLDE